jgi:hypothetical protein
MTRWFSGRGCVVVRPDRLEVFVGGSLIGVVEEGDRPSRDVLLVCLSAAGDVRVGRLARAFDVSIETLRQLRRTCESAGLAAVVSRRGPGAKTKMTPTLRARLEKLFDAGNSINTAHQAVSKKNQISRALVGIVHRQWVEQRGREAASAQESAVTQVCKSAESTSESAAATNSQSAVVSGEAVANSDWEAPGIVTTSASANESAGPAEIANGVEAHQPTGETRSPAIVPTAVQEATSMQHARGTGILGVV